jgi:hypothetical protein
MDGKQTGKLDFSGLTQPSPKGTNIYLAQKKAFEVPTLLLWE